MQVIYMSMLIACNIRVTHKIIWISESEPYIFIYISTYPIFSA